MPSEAKKIAIIGCGNMGKALAERLASSYTIHLYNRSFEKAELLQRQGLGTAFKTMDEAVKETDVVFLAVKPQNISEVFAPLNQCLSSNQLLVSLLSGISLPKLKEQFTRVQVVRMMPNLAISIGKGLLAYVTGKDLPSSIRETILDFSKYLGKVYWLEEDIIDPFTSLAGSGPAFAYAIIESMINAGVAMGFSNKDSKEIVYAMLQGSLLLLEESGKEPAELRKMITSPNGTTLAGLRKFEEFGVDKGIQETFLAACKRAKELGQPTN